MKISRIFSAIGHYMAGTVPPEKRIHQDFPYSSGDGWFYNEDMHNAAGLSPARDSQKVRILLNESELHHLGNCPFIAKLGYNSDPGFPQKFCAFIYPWPGRDLIGDLTSWAEKRPFPVAGVFTYGQDHATGQWISGNPVRGLICAPAASPA